MRLTGYSCTLIAAMFWATLGVFYQVLITNYQLSPLTIAFYRAFIAALVLYITIGVSNWKQLQINKRDWFFFFALA
jgi:drug/metabolite transporter (DMT)-like permease